MGRLEDIKFDNLVLRSLPVEERVESGTRQVRGACFSKVSPTPLKNPKLVAASPDALKLLDLDAKEVRCPTMSSVPACGKIYTCTL